MITRKRIIAMLVMAGLFAFLALVLRPSTTEEIVFTTAPNPAAASWEIPKPDDNHIGEVISATLRITSVPGVRLNLTELPDVGDIWKLPDKYVSSSGMYDGGSYSPEGNIEVASRVITTFRKDDHVVTEVAYGFLYLDPIDLTNPVDDKRMPNIIPIYQEYKLLTNAGVVESRKDNISVDSADFSISPRVDKTSKPIFTMFSITRPITNWPNVRIIGFGLVGFGICILVFAGIRRARSFIKGKSSLEQTLGAIDFYRMWQNSHDHEMFIETLKRFRRGAWGRPKATMWMKTTFILYSGVSLSQEEENSVFSQIVAEVSHEQPA